MPLAATAPKSRLASAKTRQPVASASTTSARPTTASSREKAAPPNQPTTPPLQLHLPPPLPTISDIQATHNIKPSPQLITRRLVSLAHSYLSLQPDSASSDHLDWELDLCSATFFSIYAVCLDPSSIVARRTLARCARLGGFNVVLPFSPSGSSASATVTASRLSSYDPHDYAGSQACLHLLQQGSASTFHDAGSAREYRDACRTLGRESEAVQGAQVIHEKALGKRKTVDAAESSSLLPEPVSPQSRYHSQLQTDAAYGAASRERIQEARKSFLKAIEQDPFNWRAWTGLCDTGYGAASANQHFGAATLDRLYANHVMDIQAPYSSMEATLKGAPSFPGEHAQSETMVRKVSEDRSNKKFKVSSEVPPVPTLNANTIRLAASSKPTDKVTPPLPTTSESNVTATRLHPASRALSTAHTNTNHLEQLGPEQNEVKAAKVNVVARPNRGTAVRTITVSNPTATQNGRQLRSTALRGDRATAVPSRTGATSQAGSVSSTSSTSSASSLSSRATVSTARTAVSTRRVGTAAPNQTTSRLATSKPASATAVRSAVAANGATTHAKKAPTTASRFANTSSLSRPGSAMSKASSASVGTASATSRAPGTLASSRTAAEAMRQKEEDNARLKLEQLSALRETCLQQLTTITHQIAADKYVLALLAQVGEAYRLLRLCHGDKAATVLSQPVLDKDASATDDRMQTGGRIPEGASATATIEAIPLLDLQVKDSLVHQLLLGRSYAECSQYASSEMHFAAARKLNPYVAPHMDVYSLVLFHLSREVKLSALAQHLAMVAPGTASTHIVVGNAFSLQKEHQTALVCFQRAAAAAPEYAYAYTLAGHEAHDLGLYDEAIAYFRSAIRCDRRHWNAWAGLGRVYLGIGEHEHAACKSLQQAIHINPSNHILWDLVGWTFSLINAPAKALECFNKAIELAPSASVLTYLRRAELLLHNGDPESSHQDLVRAHDLAPEEASIHILLAQSYMRLGDGAFCHLESAGPSSNSGAPKANAVLRATGVMVLPSSFQAEITHHLSVAIDLDPSLLRLVKSICEGYKTLPGNKLSLHPHEVTNASFTQSHVSMAESGMMAYDHSGFGMVGHSYRSGASGLTGLAPQLQQGHGLVAPADFAMSRAASGGMDSSFLSMTPGHSQDIILEDAEASS